MDGYLFNNTWVGHSRHSQSGGNITLPALWGDDPTGWASEGDRAPQFRQMILLFLRCHLTVAHGSGQSRVMKQAKQCQVIVAIVYYSCGVAICLWNPLEDRAGVN